MKKIIVAGAGHGGLTAAFILAKKGYDVTVIEARKSSELGHDWHDCVWMPDFERLGLKADDSRFVLPFFHYTYHNPKETVAVTVSDNSIENLRMMDRKYLITLLIDECKKNGVRFEFGKKITGAITEGNRVAGVHTAKKEYRGDLVIDAAGIDSPVRRSLPAKSGVRAEIDPGKIIYTYRAYYENRLNKPAPESQNIYFFHCGRAGMDWIVTEKDFVDVLVGNFEPLTDEAIDEAVEDFRRIYSHMGETVLRGGTVTKIPIGIAIPKFVWNGYAAAGDSCSMSEPMSGSGINRAMCAGEILAETVLGIAQGDFTQENLWKYEYDYLKKHGENSYSDAILRELLASMTAEDFDWFFEHKILTEAEIGGAAVKFTSPVQMLQKAAAFVPKAYLLPRITEALGKLSAAEKVKALLPEKYSRNSYAYWLRYYNQI